MLILSKTQINIAVFHEASFHEDELRVLKFIIETGVLVYIISQNHNKNFVDYLFQDCLIFVDCKYLEILKDRVDCIIEFKKAIGDNDKVLYLNPQELQTRRSVTQRLFRKLNIL